MTTLVILAWLATGLGLGYGWSRDHIRANKAEQRAGVQAVELGLRAIERDDLADEIQRAEQGRTLAETEAALYLRKIGEVAAERAHAVIALDNERAEHRLTQRACASHCEAIDRGFWLPTIEGNYLDTVANLPVGWVLDLGWNADETPIGAGVVDSLAEVVPLRGRS